MQIHVNAKHPEPRKIAHAIAALEKGDAFIATDASNKGPVNMLKTRKGQVDVAIFAEQFGGGGHARASGLKVEHVTFEDARARVVNAMERQLSRNSPI